MKPNRRILAIVGIFMATSIAWLGLATVIEQRTNASRFEIRNQVADLYGDEHHTMSPEISYKAENSRTPQVNVVPESSDITVRLHLDQRKKGLLWYSTYAVGFLGNYTIQNATGERGDFTIRFTFPTSSAIYDNFLFRVGNEEVALERGKEGQISHTLQLDPGQEMPFVIAYDSRGLDRWYYMLGREVSQVKNFKLTMLTDFDSIDFPNGTISPTAKRQTDDGWELVWEYDNLISGFHLGMEMPRRLDPGPLAQQITMFAPVTLLFFFFIIFVLSVLRNIKIHPMNYFFLAAAFFSFHLLFAYLVDHIDIHLAFIISSLTSVGLVVSYLRLVVGPRFAFVEAGLAQLIYLVLFSYAHFFKGFTGLTVTIGSIATLAVLMQVTGRIDWEERLE